MAGRLTRNFTSITVSAIPIITPMEALWRNMSVFDPKFYDPAKAVKIDPATGLVVSGLGRPV